MEEPCLEVVGHGGVAGVLDAVHHLVGIHPVAHLVVVAQAEKQRVQFESTAILFSIKL